MKMQITLNDSNLYLVIAQLRTVLEAPYFTYNGMKFAGGKVTIHPWKDVVRSRKKRPMISFTFNGASKDCFCEGDTIISYDADKIVIKGENEKTFTKTTVTDKEAKRIAAIARMNKEYAEKCEKAYWVDLKAEMFADV